MIDERKKQYKSVTLRLGAAVLLQFTLMRVIGWNGNVIFHMLTGGIADEITVGILDCFLYLISFMIPVALFRLLSIGKRTETMHLGVRMDGEGLLWLGAGIGLVTAMAFLGNMMFRYVDFSWVFVEDNVGGAPQTVLSFISTAVVPAVAEEFLYRGCVLSNLLPYGKTQAIFGSALLFALMHSNPLQFFYAFCAGLALGTVFAETGSIWPGMFIHLFNNFISTAEDVLTANADAYYTGLLLDLLETVFILGGIVCFLLLLWRKNGKIVSDTTEDRGRQGASLSGFFSVTVILFTVLCVLRALLLLGEVIFYG